ncbi:MAG: hypothetical protein AAGK74_00750 [Chloroflexota bacterium]
MDQAAVEAFELAYAKLCLEHRLFHEGRGVFNHKGELVQILPPQPAPLTPRGLIELAAIIADEDARIQQVEESDDAG